MRSLVNVLIISLFVMISALMFSSTAWCMKSKNKFGRQVCFLSGALSGAVAFLAAIFLTFSTVKRM